MMSQQSWPTRTFLSPEPVQPPTAQSLLAAPWMPLMRCALAAAALLALVACKSPSSTSTSSSAAPSASGPPPPFPLGVPVLAASVAAAINPKGEQPYSGPSATLRGTIRIKGDPPPDSGLSFPPQC